MDDLPLDLLDEILFRLDPISMASLGCTDKKFQSYIFDSYRFPEVKSCLFHVSIYGSNHVYCMPFVSSRVSMSPGDVARQFENRCYILGCCSGLLLVYIDGLFVVNPLTKRFRILDHTGSKLLANVVGNGKIYNDGDNREANVARIERAMCIGFTVDRKQTTKKFKVVCILEMETMYRFEISDGDSWYLSKTTITTSTKSDLMTRMKPVYLDNTLHWLRNDGSIIAFNPYTEQARLIFSTFHQTPDMKLLFAVDEKMNRLTLISGTKETITVYTLLENRTWTLYKQIKNVSMEEKYLVSWNVVVYDGKCIMLKEEKCRYLDGMVHVYDMETNNWGVLGSASIWANGIRDFSYTLFRLRQGG